MKDLGLSSKVVDPKGPQESWSWCRKPGGQGSDPQNKAYKQQEDELVVDYPWFHSKRATGIPKYFWRLQFILELPVLLGVIWPERAII